MEETKKSKKEKTIKRAIVEEIADTPVATDISATSPETEIKIEKETPTESSESMELEVATEKPIVPSEPKEEIKEESKPEPEKPPKPKKNGISPVWLIIPVIILLAAFAGGIYVYQTGVKVSQPEETAVPEETASPTSTPEASPSATPNLTSFTIDIQNGSGIIGEAGKVKTLLEKAGFKVGTTGNASSYDYEKTVIKTTKEVGEDFLASLTVALEKTYILDKNEVLPATSSSDIVIIVGKTKVQ